MVDGPLKSNLTGGERNWSWSVTGMEPPGWVLIKERVREVKNCQPM